MSFIQDQKHPYLITRSNTMDNCCIVILAAGQSSRLGRPKQLIEINGKTNIRRIIEEAKSIVIPQNVFVVLGSNYEEIYDHIKEEDIYVIYNKEWNLGISSSIKVAIREILIHKPEINQIIIAVCDQPFTDSAIFKKLMDEYIKTQKPIIASAYASINGTPVLFDKSMFEHLITLEGDTGAGKIIKKNNHLLACVDFPKGVFDIDTEEDLEKIHKNQQ